MPMISDTVGIPSINGGEDVNCLCMPMPTWPETVGSIFTTYPAVHDWAARVREAIGRGFPVHPTASTRIRS